MKAERRHELKENDLQQWLDVARSYLNTNGTRLGVIAVVLLAVVAAVVLGVQSRNTAVERIWQRRSELSYDETATARESLVTLGNLAEESTDDGFALTALMDQGSQALRLCAMADSPPDRALNEIAKAAFNRLLERFGNEPLAFGLAHCGLATVEENAFVLDEDPAHKGRAATHLAAVIDNPALNGLPYKRIALDRQRGLDDTFTKVEFDWSASDEAIGASVIPPLMGISTPGAAGPGLTVTPVGASDSPVPVEPPPSTETPPGVATEASKESPKSGPP